MAASDVVFPEGSDAARYQAAYRRWLNLDPYPTREKAAPRHRSTSEDLDLSQPIELVVLSVKENAVRCRFERMITPSLPGDIVPGEIATVTARKQWRYAGHPYLSGEIVSSRLDATALGLAPLRLEAFQILKPKIKVRAL